MQQSRSVHLVGRTGFVAALQSAFSDPANPPPLAIADQGQKNPRSLIGDRHQAGDAWPTKPFSMSRKVYERHIRKLIEIEGAINTLERVASPADRRQRERNRDGSFVTQYDQLEMR
ncbi:MAG: hypothetical protein WB041_17795 [Pseudolabrys sp.]